MITPEQALEIVKNHFVDTEGIDHDTIKLEEVAGGWKVVVEASDSPLIGFGSYFIDDKSGQVVGYPSSVGPTQAQAEFEKRSAN